MTERLITHLRHIDLAVPDHAKQLNFFTGPWGLAAEHSDTGLTFLAAEGSPEQYVVRLRQADDKRIDLIAFGAASAETGRTAPTAKVTAIMAVRRNGSERGMIMPWPFATAIGVASISQKKGRIVDWRQAFWREQPCESC